MNYILIYVLIGAIGFYKQRKHFIEDISKWEVLLLISLWPLLLILFFLLALEKDEPEEI